MCLEAARYIENHMRENVGKSAYLTGPFTASQVMRSLSSSINIASMQHHCQGLTF